MALPKTIGTVADNLFKLREKRLALDRQVSELKGKESELQKHGIQLLNSQRITSGRGKLATFSINLSPVPSVVDWDAVYKFIAKENAFDLLQKRIGGGWKERLELGESVPGIKAETVTKVSLTKVK